MDDSSSESSSGDENIPIIEKLLRMPIQSEMLSDESSSEDDMRVGGRVRVKSNI